MLSSLPYFLVRRVLGTRRSAVLIACAGPTPPVRSGLGGHRRGAETGGRRSAKHAGCPLVLIDLEVVEDRSPPRSMITIGSGLDLAMPNGPSSSFPSIQCRRSSPTANILARSGSST
jgi:hypothetical protein